nr:ATP synthase F0 subunit 8 [Gallerucida bifasciata]
MPQMMPLNWLSLFFTFLWFFYLFNNWNYFNFLYKPKIKMFKFNKNLNYWKW